MAMSSCPECSKPLSEHADSCPHCGISGAAMKSGRENRALGQGCGCLLVIGFIILWFGWSVISSNQQQDAWLRSHADGVQLTSPQLTGSPPEDYREEYRTVPASGSSDQPSPTAPPLGLPTASPPREDSDKSEGTCHTWRYLQLFHGLGRKRCEVDGRTTCGLKADLCPGCANCGAEDLGACPCP